MARQPTKREVLSNRLEQEVLHSRSKAPLRSYELEQSVKGMQFGAAIVLSNADQALSHVHETLGDNLLAAYVVGAPGRGKLERIPDHGRMVVVTRTPAKLPRQKNNVLLTPVTLAELVSHLKGEHENAETSREHRLGLSLDSIALHGVSKVQQLRAFALNNLREEDVNTLVTRLIEREKRPTRKQSDEQLRTHVMEKYGISEALRKSKEVQSYFAKRARNL